MKNQREQKSWFDMNNEGSFYLILILTRATWEKFLSFSALLNSILNQQFEFLIPRERVYVRWQGLMKIYISFYFK